MEKSAMMRKLQEFIDKASMSLIDYEYKVDSIEKYLDGIEAERYEVAKKFVDEHWNEVAEFPKIVEERDFDAEERLLRREIREREERTDKFHTSTYISKYREPINALWDEMYASKPELPHGAFIRAEHFGLDYKKRLDKLNKDFDKEVKDFKNLPENSVKELKQSVKQLLAEKRAEKEIHTKWNAWEKNYGAIAQMLNLRNCQTIDDAYAKAEKYSKIYRESFRYDIYSRCADYVGKLVDMKYIDIVGGSLNGIVVGETGRRARVETIVAGGYNIQRLHYRVLVFPLDS